MITYGTNPGMVIPIGALIPQRPGDAVFARALEYMGLNAGFIALCINFAVTGVVSLLTPVRVRGFEETVPALAASQSADGANLT